MLTPKIKYVHLLVLISRVVTDADDDDDDNAGHHSTTTRVTYRQLTASVAPALLLVNLQCLHVYTDSHMLQVW